MKVPRSVWITTAIGLGLLAAVWFVPLRKLYVIPTSPSIPFGVYWITPDAPVSSSDYVSVSESPLGIRLLKQAGVLGPASVTIVPGGFASGDFTWEYHPNAPEFGHEPWIPRDIAAGEVLLYGSHPASIDSRYFGPVPIHTMVRVIPLWQRQ